MPVPAQLASDPAISGPLGSLALSVVRAGAPMLVLRALGWYRSLARLGLRVPFFLVHDLGMLYAAPREQLAFGPRPVVDAIAPKMPRLREVVAAYHAVVNEVAQGEACVRARSLRLGDDLVVVVLARLLGSLASRLSGRPTDGATIPLDAELVRDLDGQLEGLFFAVQRGFEISAVDTVARARLFLLTLADALDLDTLRLLGMLGPESGAAGALAHVDLIAAVSSPAANDIVNFSLELLPSILETRRTRAMGLHAVDGYAGIGTKGSLDSLVLTELAWDTEEFSRRMLENELLYYTREQAPEEARRLHYLLIDASASMRGDRQVFARGLAIALGKKLQLAGEEVWFRFFDSRLYDVQKARGGQLPAAYLLGFRGERGRNPARVFAQLATELAILRAREARDAVVHLLTHGALHVPRPLLTEVRRYAHLFGVFMLPSGGTLDLDYLDLLEGHAVVDHATLQQKNARAQAATKIVDEATKMTERVSVAPPSLGAPRSMRDDAIPPSLRPPRSTGPTSRGQPSR